MWSQRLRFQGFFYNAPPLDFRTSKNKKNRRSLKLTLTHQMEHKKLVTGISISIISAFENTTDENNDMTLFK